MSYKNTIFNYNAIAVDFMMRGRYREAHDSLKVALLCLQDAQTAAPSTLSDAPIGNGTTNPDSEETEIPPRRRGIRSVKLLSHEDASKASPNNLFLLYAAAFTVHPDQAHATTDAQWTTILLYNIAISRHLYALIHRPKDDRALRLVLDIYQTVIRTVYCTWEDRDSIWLTMAAACNQGHIHSHRLDFSSTRETISLLLRLAMLPQTRSVVPKAEFQFFFDTVCIFMEGMDLTLAPAA